MSIVFYDIQYVRLLFIHFTNECWYTYTHFIFIFSFFNENKKQKAKYKFFQLFCHELKMI